MSWSGKGGGTTVHGRCLSHEGRWKHKAKAVYWRRKAVEAQGNGNVRRKKGSGSTRQRWCLVETRQWKQKLAAASARQRQCCAMCVKGSVPPSVARPRRHGRRLLPPRPAAPCSSPAGVAALKKRSSRSTAPTFRLFSRAGRPLLEETFGGGPTKCAAAVACLVGSVAAVACAVRLQL